MKKEKPVCPVPIWQDPSELKDLLKEVKKIKPQSARLRVLEIGSLNGGTLWTWINELKPEKLCIIDLPVDKSDFRSPDQQRGHGGLWSEWCKEIGCELNVIPGRSDDPNAYRDVMSLSRKYDFVFVDGGHSYDEVSLDYINFFPHINHGGIMAFHDINENECPGVIRFWDEIKTKHTHKEFKRLIGKWGIGVIYVD